MTVATRYGDTHHRHGAVGMSAVAWRAVMAALVLGVGACGDGRALGGGSGEVSRSDAPADVVIVMTDAMTFEPSEVTIPVGSTVEWVNQDNLPHTTTIRDHALPLEMLPDGAAAWDSGLLQRGERFRVTLSTPGEYRYVCTLHLAQNMVGRIRVEAETGQP